MAAPLDGARAQEADLSIAASDSPDPVSPDADVTYTVTVTNNGPDPTPATVNMNNGGELRFQSLITPAGWSCTAPPVGAAPSVICTTLSFAVGSQVFTMVANADAGLLGPSDTTFDTDFDIETGVSDPNLGNNSTTVTTTYDALEAELAVTLSGPATAAPGDQLTYTYSVTNNGPDAAPNVVVSDAPQPGMTFVSVTAPPGFNCITPLVGAEGPITCTTVTMANGATANFTLVVVAPPGGPAALNALAAAADAGDPNLANNDAMATTLLTSPQPEITALSPNVGFSSGGTSVTITGQNFTGATDVTFGGVAATSFTVDSDTEITAVTPGGTGEVAVEVTTPSGAAEDPSLSFTYVEGPSLSAAGPSGTVYTDEVFETTFTVTNNNIVALQDVELTWVTPTGLFYVSATPSQGSAAPGEATLGALAAGASATVVLSYSATEGGEYEVAATASATNGAPDSEASAVFTITPAADLAMIVSVPVSVQAGADLTFNMTVTNNGPDAASGLELTTVLPADLTFTSISPPAGWSCTTPASGATGTITCNRAALDAEADGFFSVSTTVSASASGSISLSASIASSSHDATAGNDSDEASVTVEEPAPTAQDMTVSVPYETATPIDLDVNDAATGAEVGVEPVHGDVSIAGTVATYTPDDGYSGADSFTYAATGPGGTSAAATVTITVGTPAPPIVAGVSDVLVDHNSSGTEIALEVTGVFSTVAVQSDPSHGTVTITGTTATYVPTSGYSGDDSFTVTATGPGGTSAAATVSLVVAAPGAPTVTNPDPISLTITTAQPTPTATIDLTAQTTGVFTAISTSLPEHGSVSLTTTERPGQTPLVIATYTANTDYAGADTFTFVATGPGGESNTGTVTINISGTTPVLQPLTATTTGGVPVFVDLTLSATGGPFTTASIVSVAGDTLASAETTTTGPGKYELKYTPANDKAGAVTVTYTLANRFGASTGTVVITVKARAVTATTLRLVADFSTVMVGQSNDAWKKTLALDVARAAKISVNRVTVIAVTSGLRLNGAPDLSEPNLEGPFPGINARLAAEHTRDEWFLATAGEIAGVSGTQSAARAPAQPGAVSEGPLKVWVGGSVTFGRRKSSSGELDLDILSSGIVTGVDMKPTPNSGVGVSVGYSRAITDIGQEGSRVEGVSWMSAIYGGIRPAEGLFVSGVLGAGRLDFDVDRALEGDGMATGKRDAGVLFGGVEAGFERTESAWNLSSYGRLEFSQGEFDAYAETGGGLDNLSYARMESSSLQIAFGARGQLVHELRSGIVTPRAMLEVLHEFADIGDQTLQFADWLDGPTYLAPGRNGGHNRVRIGLGNTAILKNGWSIDVDAETELGRDQVLGTFRLKAQKDF